MPIFTFTTNTLVKTGKYIKVNSIFKKKIERKMIFKSLLNAIILTHMIYANILNMWWRHQVLIRLLNKCLSYLIYFQTTQRKRFDSLVSIFHIFSLKYEKGKSHLETNAEKLLYISLLDNYISLNMKYEVTILTIIRLYSFNAQRLVHTNYTIFLLLKIPANIDLKFQ